MNEPCITLRGMTSEQSPGRRERKKAATRQSIADAALELFLARGFDAVSIREIAERADVSTTTIFKHFTGKEALLFDRSEDFSSELTSAVTERPEGTPILEALRSHALTTWVPISTDPRLVGIAGLLDQTPALREYADRLWARHSDDLAAVIAEASGRPENDLRSATLARFVVQVPALIRERTDPAAAANEIFDLLRDGWGTDVPNR